MIYIVKSKIIGLIMKGDGGSTVIVNQMPMENPCEIRSIIGLKFS